MRALIEDDGILSSGSAYLLVLRLIDSTPTLLAAHLRYLRDHDNEIVAVLARREGVDPSDQRPWLLAAMFGSLLFLANREWNSEGHGTVEAMLATFDAYADGLNPSLFGHW
jgi:hypothetical protein